jgi:2-C-methyl-D-erythritol 4-phosphate cytidylyltransferase
MRAEETHDEQVAAIVLAAGLGSRFGPDKELPKQFLELAGEPVLVRSVRAMLACPAVGTVACAVPAAWRGHAETVLDAAGLLPRVVVLDGGATRQESARRSLAALAGPTEPDLVLIHDAARPLVPIETVEASLHAAREHGAATVAAPAVDTIATRIVDRLDSVLDRPALVAIQTPQAFRYALIRQAHEHAAKEGVTDAPDDATLVLGLGHQVVIVPGSPTNIKITSPVDLELARLLLAHSSQRAARREE